MLANATLIAAKLNFQCKQKRVTSANLVNCCKIIVESYKFDSVFLAQSQGSEDPPSVLASHGKEEIVDACLYRLGVEERAALAKLPSKTYSDITGKPVFNRSGSLRIQKPNSGIFLVVNQPKKLFLLLGCAHQNSQAYDPKLLEELQDLWKQWQESLEPAIQQLSSPFKAEAPISVPSPVSPKMATPSGLDRLTLDPVPVVLPAPAPVVNPPSVAPAFVSPKPAESKKDGKRPIILVDEVTRLFNKDYFSECLAIEVERAKRYSRMMSLIFMSVSPMEGASVKAEDPQVANQVAEILSKSLRRVDIICRLEKNKYGIVLPDTANNTYGVIAKRIFKFFKLVMGENPTVFLNISASTYPKHAPDYTTLLENAEKLLAQAQEVGPNKAVLPD